MYKLIFFLFFTFLFACQDDGCESSRLEDQFFTQESISYQSWIDKSEFVFKDISGIEYLYTLDLSFKDRVENEFVKLDCDDENEIIAYSTDRSLFRFIGPLGTAFSYLHTVEFLNESEPKDEDLVDKLTFSIIDASALPNKTLKMASFITDSKNSIEDIDLINNLAFTFQDSITINNKPFYNVFQINANLNDLMFTKAEGLIAFTNKDGLFLYQESSN